MEMVLARAARMAAEQGGAEQGGAEQLQEEGMRAGAAYMRGAENDLAVRLDGCPAADRPHFVRGVASALLRNIILPRADEQLETARQAMGGLVQVGRNNPELLALCGDLTKILEQYRQHGEQLKEQLEANFAPLMPQLEAAMAQKTGQLMKLKPAQHPKFQEELQRAMDDLNGQYGRAIDQHKQLVVQILTSLV
jgi:hypothetical protein